MSTNDESIPPFQGQFHRCSIHDGDWNATRASQINAVPQLRVRFYRALIAVAPGNTPEGPPLFPAPWLKNFLIFRP